MATKTLKERVKAHAPHEASESKAQERAESPAFQRMERKLGVEKHSKEYSKKRK